MIEAVSPVALIRGVHLAAMLSMFGTLTVTTWILPAASIVPDRLRQRLVRLWWISGVVALVAGAMWFVLQAAAIAEADTVSAALTALPLVAGQTRFGTLLIARLGLLLIVMLLGIMVPRPASLSRCSMMVLMGVALGFQGAIGHAGATDGTIGIGLVLSETLHLLAAGAWLGALLPFALALSALSTADAAALCQRFSPIGLACVMLLAGTGLAQGLELIGTVPALIGTSYGHITLLKVAFFLLAVALAAINRLWLTDRLSAGLAQARRQLLVSVGLETFIGLMIIAAAAFLASTVPGVHDTPVWPFAWRFSLKTMSQQPAYERQVIVSVLMIVAAALLMVATLRRRRFRLAALVVAAAIIVWQGPSLALLTVEAYPTSFQQSPSGFTAASIERGRMLFDRDCAACHGSEGNGRGPLAAGLRTRPADLTMPHLWDHSDGELFWWVSHGVVATDGGLAMPGFAALPVSDRWALVDYVRAHAAGAAFRRDAMLDVPVRAPGIAVRCAGIAALTMDDLHGYAVDVLMTASPDEQPAAGREDGIATVTLVISPTIATIAEPHAGSCVADDPDAWAAYSVLAALPADKPGEAELLVDPQGWLRAARRPGDTGEWHSRNDLLAAIHTICSHPIEQAGGGQHEHHH